MQRKILSCKEGFTLIEVLVALSIFAIGLLAIAQMQMTALKSNSYAYSLTAINAVAAGIVEEIISWPPEDPRLVANGTHAWDFDPTATVQTVLPIQGGGNFTAEYTIAADTPLAKMTTFTVEVEATGVLKASGLKNKTVTYLKKTQ
ncbi:MAG: prepilin-type N-terminal cleavage/methylation domain-containing protein [Desulfuromonadales bacterium]